MLLVALFGCAREQPGLRLASPVEPQAILLPLPTASVAPAPAPPEASHTAVVLVTIDGVRWQEVFGGVDRRLAREHGLAASEIVGPAALVPELHALVVGEGAAIGAPGSGEPIAASDPAVKSLPGYMEITSGRAVTDCATNHCPRITAPTILDQLATTPDVQLGDAAVIASWPGIASAAAAHPSHIVLSAGRTTGTHLTRLRFDSTATKLWSAGKRSGALPGYGDYRPDRYTAAIALHYLRARHPRFLFIGLGDTDEWAHKNRYRRYLDALHRADALVGEVVRTLASLHERGWSTALFVTADHGRDPECRNHGGVASAARTWLVAGGSLVRAHGRVRAPVKRYLADIAPTLRSLMQLDADTDARAGHVLDELLVSDVTARVAARDRD